MTSISNIDSSSPYVKNSESTNESFNDKVLGYFQQNKPQDNLNDMMEKMRALSPDDKSLTMHQLNEALLYSDTYMRNNTPEDREYAKNVLDKRASQLLGVNMFYNNMMYNSFTDYPSIESY